MVAEIKAKVEHFIGDGDEQIGNLELQSWRKEGSAGNFGVR